MKNYFHKCNDCKRMIPLRYARCIKCYKIKIAIIEFKMLPIVDYNKKEENYDELWAHEVEIALRG